MAFKTLLIFSVIVTVTALQSTDKWTEMATNNAHDHDASPEANAFVDSEAASPATPVAPAKRLSYRDTAKIMQRAGKKTTTFGGAKDVDDWNMVTNTVDCNLCACGTHDSKDSAPPCDSGRDRNGILKPTEYGAQTCRLTKYGGDKGGSRMSTERANRRNSDQTTGGAARYDMAKDKINAIHAMHRKINNEQPTSPSNPLGLSLQFVPDRKNGDLPKEAMTCSKFHGIFQPGINRLGKISHGQVMISTRDSQVFISRVWSSQNKNPRGTWWDPTIPDKTMNKNDYALRNVICPEWNPTMDRCGVCPVRSDTLFGIGLGQDGTCCRWGTKDWKCVPKPGTRPSYQLIGNGVQVGIADPRNDIDYERCVPCRCVSPKKENDNILTIEEWDAVAKNKNPQPGCHVRPLPGGGYDTDLKGYADMRRFKDEEDWKNPMTGNNPGDAKKDGSTASDEFYGVYEKAKAQGRGTHGFGL